jgi:hypothetical protein
MKALEHASECHNGRTVFKTSVLAGNSTDLTPVARVHSREFPAKSDESMIPRLDTSFSTVKCWISHDEPGKIEFSNFSSNHALKETKSAASSFPDLF